MRVLNPGAWYLLFLCKNCNTKQVLFPDLSNGKSEINAIYHLPCPECGFEATCDAENIERYQHPIEAATVSKTED
jgi:hypothetical protein